MIKLLFLSGLALLTPFPLFYTYLNTKNTCEAIKVDDLTCFIK